MTPRPPSSSFRLRRGPTTSTGAIVSPTSAPAPIWPAVRASRMSRRGATHAAPRARSGHTRTEDTPNFATS